MIRIPTGPLVTAPRLCGLTVRHGFVDLFLDPARAGSFWRRVASAIDSFPRSRLKLEVPDVPLVTLFPDAETTPVTLVDYVDMPGIMPFHELLTLCQIVRLRQPKVIFEIGTFLGGTTLQLAANSHAEVYTLDLPPPRHEDYVKPPIWDPELDVYPDQPGVRFQGIANAGRISQLFGNSLTYDFTEYSGLVDLVFVDGCHHYEFVLRDSQNALKMMSPDGIVIWQDYSSYAPGVVQALNELSNVVSLVHIAKTSLVIHRR